MSRYAYLALGEGRYRERFGLSFEDVSVGMVIQHRPGVDISQQDNREESLDFLNNAHLHYDSHYASCTEWEQPLFVSTITIQRLFGMASRSWYRRRNVVAIDSIILSAPLFGGDTLYAESRVIGLEDTGDGDVGHVHLEILGKNARGDKVAQANCIFEVFRRGRHPEDGADDTLAEEARFLSHHDGADGALVEQTGLWFDDLREGESFIHWPGRTITAEEGRTSALRSLEINPRWHDAAFQSRYPELDQRVGEALLIGVVTALTTRSMGRVVANLGWRNIKFPNPLRYGDTLYAESRIVELRASNSRPSQGLAKVETHAFNQHGQLVCSYERALLIYRRGEGPFTKAGY